MLFDYNGFLLQSILQWIRIVMPSQLKPNASDCQAGTRCPALQYESIVKGFTMEIDCEENGKEEDEEEDGDVLRLQWISIAKHFTMDS